MLDRLKEKAKSYWSNLQPKQKQGHIFAGCIIMVGLIGVWTYMGRAETRTREPAQAEASVNLNPLLLEKTELAEMRLLQEQRAEENMVLRQEIEDLKLEQNRFSQRDADFSQSIAKETPVTRTERLTFMPPPPPTQQQTAPTAVQAAVQVRMGPVVTGSIEIVTGQEVQEPLAPKEEGKKSQKVYLPPSFMEATLLSGLDAKTVESARNDPEPVLLRVKDMAILPNEIKSNLKGCFVIAHGYGSLDTERVALRLVSLSCITTTGASIIDQQIKGFVVDNDGKIGLRGTVISKMGSMLSRTFLAGFFGGAGDALSASAKTTTVGPLGVTTGTISNKELGKAAIGGGIGKSADALQNFYLELARQTMPIIEVGATKVVTLVISEGVELTLKQFCTGDQECDISKEQ